MDMIWLSKKLNNVREKLRSDQKGAAAVSSQFDMPCVVT